MQGNYKFYFINDELHCTIKNKISTRFYSGNKAYSQFKKINNEYINTCKVKKTINKQKIQKPFIRLTGNKFNIIIKNINKFSYYNLFEELNNHYSRLNKLFEKSKIL